MFHDESWKPKRSKVKVTSYENSDHGVTTSDFCRDLWHQKTRVPGLSYMNYRMGYDIIRLEGMLM